MLRYVDSFSVDQVAAALRTLRPSDKALTMVRAHASSKNRAMSRLELAKTVGGERPHTCNGVYGHFGKALATALDPSLAGEWKPDSPAQAETSGDWVMFLNRGLARWTPAGPGEVDAWVFVMRETLARALAEVGIAPYRELDKDARAHMDDYEAERSARSSNDGDYESEDEDDDLAPADPLVEIQGAEEELAELDETERDAVIRARVGQGQFRGAVIERWGGRCAVTGVDFLPALVASHIKPWVDCTNEERLDPANGLLLVGTLDRLFDAGYISFGSDGQIMISPTVPMSRYAALGLSKNLRLRAVPSDSLGFLSDHLRDYFEHE